MIRKITLFALPLIITFACKKKSSDSPQKNDAFAIATVAPQRALQVDRDCCACLYDSESVTECAEKSRFTCKSASCVWGNGTCQSAGKQRCDAFVEREKGNCFAVAQGVVPISFGGPGEFSRLFPQNVNCKTMKAVWCDHSSDVTGEWFNSTVIEICTQRFECSHINIINPGCATFNDFKSAKRHYEQIQRKLAGSKAKVEICANQLCSGVDLNENSDVVLRDPNGDDSVCRRMMYRTPLKVTISEASCATELWRCSTYKKCLSDPSTKNRFACLGEDGKQKCLECVDGKPGAEVPCDVSFPNVKPQPIKDYYSCLETRILQSKGVWPENCNVNSSSDGCRYSIMSSDSPPAEELEDWVTQGQPNHKNMFDNCRWKGFRGNNDKFRLKRVRDLKTCARRTQEEINILNEELATKWKSGQWTKCNPTFVMPGVDAHIQL